MAIVVQVSDMTLGLKLLLSVLFSVEMMGNGHCILKKYVCLNNFKQPV